MLNINIFICKVPCKIILASIEDAHIEETDHKSFERAQLDGYLLTQRWQKKNVFFVAITAIE